MKYECYIARYNGVVVYVGEGKTGRHSHVNSGKSHVVELNQMVFSDMVLDIEVIPCNSKKESEIIERHKIKELNPMFNTIYSDSRKREEDVDNFLGSLGVRGYMKPDNVSANISEPLNVSEDCVRIKVKGRYVIIKDVPVSYARVHKSYIDYKGFSGHPTSAFSLVAYLTLEQILHIADNIYDQLEYEKVELGHKSKQANLTYHPYAKGLYAVQFRRREHNFNRTNKVEVYDKVDGKLVVRNKGIVNGATCSLKLLYEEGYYGMYLHTVVVK